MRLVHLNLEKSAQVMHISQQYFKSGDATIARRSRPPRRHDWSNTPDRAASFSVPLCSDYPRGSNARTSKRAATKGVRLPTTVVPSIVCGKEETAWGDQVTRSDGRGGGAARKKQSTHRKERHWHLLACFEERVCVRKSRTTSLKLFPALF